MACACLDTSGVASLRHDKHTPRKRKQSNKRKMKAQTGRSLALNRLPNLSPDTVVQSSSFLIPFIPFSTVFLVGFPHLLYHLRADRPNVTAFVPTRKVIKEQQFSIFLPDSADNIFVHNIRDKILW